MKSSRVGLALGAMALLLLAYGGSKPQAFHSGGVAECAGCHSMHSPKPGGTNLLIGSDVSSTCLSCHMNAADTGPNGYHVSTIDAKFVGVAGAAPLQRTPGGDFGWLKKTYSYSASGTNYVEDGATHGHNIVATDYGYVADATNTSAPGGGSYPANKLACDSCHDPHGKYRRTVAGTVETSGVSGGAIWASGSYPTATGPLAGGGYGAVPAEPRVLGTENLSVGVYRLLAGQGYMQGGALGTAIAFPGVPAAKVPSSYNRSEATMETRAAYGASTASGHATWGNWCGTCHPNMHSTGHYVHPIDTGFTSGMASAYGAYVKSGDNGGTAPYLSLVPFIENTGNYATLASHAVSDVALGASPGPNPGDQVSCLSCHRAHASGFMEGLRFDIEYEFMTKEGQYVGSDNPVITGSRAPLQHRGRTNAEWQAAYYDRPAARWSAYQRVLCNKCHVKD
jgi:hypothetical protein